MSTLLYFIAIFNALLLMLTAAEPKELIDYFQNSQLSISTKARKTTAQRIAAHGYQVESHQIETEDGYILNIFRIPRSHSEPSSVSSSSKSKRTRSIVLLQHGLFGCSDAWVLNGPNDALPFLLADAGYDVWLGNARGNIYARNHTNRQADNSDFWRFSWHEIGQYDLSAMIDYILATPNGLKQQSLHYVGHSQGTTTLLVLLSMRPAYNKKIRTAHLLAPVAFMANIRDGLVRTLAPYLGHSNQYTSLLSSREFVPYNELFILLRYSACNTDSIFTGLCSAIAYMAEGDHAKVNKTAMSYLAETHPAGASTDQLLHYMQEQQSGRFCQFDYGVDRNMQLYGQPKPSAYPVHLISAELHLWYSDNDDSAAVEDVEKLAGQLPYRIMHHVQDPGWAHRDFLLANEVKQFINDPLLEVMAYYEYLNQRI